MLLGTGVRAAEIFQPFQREHTGFSAGSATERTVCSCKGPVNQGWRPGLRSSPSLEERGQTTLIRHTGILLLPPKGPAAPQGSRAPPSDGPCTCQTPDRRKEHHQSDRSETKQTNHPHPPSARPDLLSTSASGSCPCDSEPKRAQAERPVLLRSSKPVRQTQGGPGPARELLPQS